MEKLTFMPHDEPQSDFIIVRHDTLAIQEKMDSIGAIRIPREEYTAYLWHSRLGNRFMIGMGVLDGHFLLGPKQLKLMPAKLGAGNYTVIDLQEDQAIIQPDLFGMNATYFSENVVTNRLQLAAIIEREIDVSNALSVLYNDGGFSFSFNTFKTPIKNVRLLPAGARAVVDQGGVRIHLQEPSNTNFGILDPSSYWALIEQGAQEVIDNVTAVVESGFPIFADITGGRDSRVVFGALLASGKIKDVIFNTIANPTSPGLKTDLEIGTGLVSHYGAFYSNRPRVIGYAEYDIQQNLARRRSQVFGSYHWIVPTDLRPISGLTRTQTIRMLGGGGELYRDYWKPMLFSSVESSLVSNDQLVEEMLNKHVGQSFKDQYFDLYLDDLLETFRNLPGQSIGHKLDAHYLNFRNRFHFGPKQSIPETMTSMNVATAPSLLAAARSLPAEERSIGRVLFDVTQVFDERLAFFPYDSEGDPRIISSHYHRKSKYDHVALHLEPATEIATNLTDKRYYERPKRPTERPWSFDEILDQEISEAMEVISDSQSCFSFLNEPQMHKYIAWAQDHSPRNRSSLASKLRAFADYSQL